MHTAGEPGTTGFSWTKWLPKQRLKQRSLRAVEIILRARFLRKVNGQQQRTVILFYCYEELQLKTLRKERSNQGLSLLGSIGRIPELFDKKFEQRTVAFSFFYGAGSDRILGNDKRVGVPVFTNRKIKTTKSETRKSDPE